VGVVLDDDSKKGQVYNVVNPEVAAWPALLPHIQKLSSIPKSVSLKEWVFALEESSRARNGLFWKRILQ
jgi:hypothetical protein